jgi:hypothetical protein
MMNIAAERARLSPDFDIGHYEPSKRLFLGLSRGWGWFATGVGLRAAGSKSHAHAD